MTNARYPADAVIARQDFLDSGWKAAAETDVRPDHALLYRQFTLAAEAALDGGEPKRAKVLWLLADASSLRLMPDSVNEPFRPVMVWENGDRSAVPEDFTPDDIAFFAAIIDDLDHPWLKARIADLLWLLRKPRRTTDASAAIDAYCATPLASNTWHRGARQAWERAAVLARQLGKKAAKQLDRIEVALYNAFDGAGESDATYALQLADTILERKLCRANGERIAEKLKTLGRHFSASGDWNAARDLFAAAGRWFTAVGDGTHGAELMLAIAELWEKEAARRTAGPNPSHMAAMSHLEQAIKVYREIPRAARAAHDVDARISELRQRLRQAGEYSIDEMIPLRSPTIDITKAARTSCKAVQGKPLNDALYSFATIYDGFDVAKERAAALEKMQNPWIHSLFPRTTLSKDGRAISHYPGIVNSKTGDETTIRFEMLQSFLLTMGIVAHGQIIPALRALSLEHRLTEGDFIELARHSWIIPPRRERSFGRALFMGFDQDFSGAIHFLIPQVEHMVRFHLRRYGAKTSNLNREGIENENGLSALVDLPETMKVFGEDLTFELRSIFCDASGPNLRNQLAHGLLDDSEQSTPYVIYAWWMCFRMMMLPYVSAAQRKAETKSPPSAQES